MKRTVRNQGRRILDMRLAELKPPIGFEVPHKGWIRAIRDALGMSSGQLGKRLGRVSGTVDDLEKSEAAGTIQLRTLRRAAEALECTLVYALVPNKTLEAFYMSRARKIAERNLRHVAHTMKLEGQETVGSDWEARIDDYINNKLTDREIWGQP